MDYGATARRFYEEMNRGDLETFADAFADDFIEHEQTPGLVPTKEGVLDFFRMYRAAFPDFRMEPQDVLVSGDKVTVRARVTGTHEGEFMGVPPSGKRFDVQLIDILRFNEAGQLLEHWGVLDAMAMMEQIGAGTDATS